MINYNTIIKKIHSVQLYEGDESRKQVNYRDGDSHAFYEMIYFLSGENYCTYNGKVLHDKADVIRILPKGECREYYIDRIEKTQCIDIYFDTDEEFCDEAFSIDMQTNAKIKTLFSKILNIWNDKPTGYINKCFSIMYDILFETEKTSFSEYMSKSQKNKIIPAIEYIHAHCFEVDFSYKVLPKLCKISYTLFRKIFISQFGISPSKYVLKLKIEKACELLSLNHFSVSEVSQACGYKDVYFFSKQFKENVGVAPSKYAL